MNKALLEVKNLTKTFGSKQAVKGLSFAVQPGTVVGLLGPNGAGKTTSFYMTMGLVKPTSGQVFFNGTDISSLAVYERARLGIGYLAQEPSVFLDLTVEENLRLVLENRVLPGLLSEDEMTPTFSSEIDELLGELQLHTLRDQKAAHLSGGERRRLEITRALANKPQLLLLDEPFANVDPLTISEMKKLIFLLKEKGISVLITDHNASEIFAIADTCYLVQQGQVLLSGTPEELAESKLAQDSYLGHDFSFTKYYRENVSSSPKKKAVSSAAVSGPSDP